MPDESPKRLIVVGDRVLIAPEEGEERTNVGLYLPPTAVESRQVQGGRVVATGPGTPMTEPASMDDEPWKIRGPDVKYLPMQARVGDYALFFRKAAVEITFEGTKYLVVPQAAILVLVRQRFRRGLAGSGIAVVPQSSATYRVVWAPVNSPEPVFFARWRHSPEGSGARGNSSPSGSVTRPFGSTSSRCWGLCSPAGASWRCCPRERGSRCATNSRRCWPAASRWSSRH